MKTLFITIGLIVLIALGTFIYSRIDTSNTPDRTPDETELPVPEKDLSTYENTTYGYSVKHEKSLSPQISSQEKVRIGETHIQVVKATPKESQSNSYEKVMLGKLKSVCNSLNKEYTCVGIASVSPFTSVAGIQGYSFYVNATPTATFGPFYAFNNNANASEGYAALVIYSDIGTTTNLMQVKNIASSLNMTKTSAQAMSLETYIKNNISSLSSMPEVLGGKFMVTRLDFSGGKGTVYYEDGHNAYTADFNYSISASGKINVKDFRVRN